MDTAFIRLGDLDPPAAGVVDTGTDLGHLARQYGGQAAQRIDIVLGFFQRRVDRTADLFQADARIGVPGPAVERHEQRLRRVVMLVLDLADDLFDQVFDRDQPSVPEYSSSTTARCTRFWRMSASRSSAPRDIGT